MFFRQIPSFVNFCTTNDENITTTKKKKSGISNPMYPPHNPEFTKLQLMGRLVRAITDLGYQTPTEIQSKSITYGVRGHNVS